MTKRTLPRLYMVSNSLERPYPAKELPELVRQLTAQLPVIVQLREKHLDARTLYELTLYLQSLMHDSDSLLFLNERLDITLAAGADGTHFPEKSCPIEKIRTVAPGMLLGKSTHSLQSALSAEEEGADYLIFGPIFDTPLKRRYGSPMGLEKLEKVSRNVSIPVFAIGGITPENTRQCMDHGAYGIAALSIFHVTTNLAVTLENFKNALDQ
ncbi:thiamine phosphate synthase [Prosthecochloris sp.]|uniref:thiamine phosphate synthase n=1 Tax=Prosthecochloris sp. TaxID=290513 RepID=UPI0025D3F1BB|nr:thiamine phosphate synthase [Prosthecochloris sp.]